MCACVCLCVCACVLAGSQSGAPERARLYIHNDSELALGELAALAVHAKATRSAVEACPAAQLLVRLSPPSLP